MILSTLLERRASLSQPTTWLRDALGGSPTASGVHVNENTALNVSAVWACVRVISETIGSLPLFTPGGCE